MSRGLGPRQIDVLRRLVKNGGEGTTTQLSDQASAAATSATRRGLATMLDRGLVRVAGYHPHRQGQPTVWVITDAGRRIIPPTGVGLDE